MTGLGGTSLRADACIEGEIGTHSRPGWAVSRTALRHVWWLCIGSWGPGLPWGFFWGVPPRASFRYRRFFLSTTPVFRAATSGPGHSERLSQSRAVLNQVERLFGEVTERCVRRGSHTAVRALEKAKLDYFDQRNKNPKPFVWAADADLILAKVERLSKRISRAGH